MANEPKEEPVRLVHDIVMAVLSLFSILLLAWYDSGGIGPLGRTELAIIDLVIVGVLGGDLLLEMRKAPDRKAFLKRRWPDWIGLVPIYFEFFGFLRIFRFVRVLRVFRLLRHMKGFLRRLQAIAKNGELVQLGIIAGAITLGGSLMVWFVERDTNPSLEAYSEALWWSIVTVTTVGYGDITPQTTLGRVLAGALMITGIGTIGLLASQVSAALMRTGSTDRPTEKTLQDGPLERLERLSKLHSSGYLTQQEFETLKAHLIQDVQEPASTG